MARRRRVWLPKHVEYDDVIVLSNFFMTSLYMQYQQNDHGDGREPRAAAAQLQGPRPVETPCSTTLYLWKWYMIHEEYMKHWRKAEDIFSFPKMYNSAIAEQ